MAKAILSFDIQWQEVPTDLSDCMMCKETIYGKIYSLALTNEQRGETTIRNECSICESCYGLLKESQ